MLIENFLCVIMKSITKFRVKKINIIYNKTDVVYIKVQSNQNEFNKTSSLIETS